MKLSREEKRALQRLDARNHWGRPYAIARAQLGEAFYTDDVDWSTVDNLVDFLDDPARAAVALERLSDDIAVFDAVVEREAASIALKLLSYASDLVDAEAERALSHYRPALEVLAQDKFERPRIARALPVLASPDLDLEPLVDANRPRLLSSLTTDPLPAAVGAAVEACRDDLRATSARIEHAPARALACKGVVRLLEQEQEWFAGTLFAAAIEARLAYDPSVRDQTLRELPGLRFVLALLKAGNLAIDTPIRSQPSYVDMPAATSLKVLRFRVGCLGGATLRTWALCADDPERNGVVPGFLEQNGAFVPTDVADATQIVRAWEQFR